MKYIIDTLGCKVNQYETQAMEALLAERGHERAKDGEAEAVVVNSCAVTAESGRKSRQALRHLAERNPGAVRAICGCWAQIEPREAEELGADLVWGSGDRRGFVEALERAVAGCAEPEVRVDRPFARREFERLPAGAFAGHARAYLKIEDGCENFCTYCVIPYARGRVRSLPPEEAAAQAAALAAEGYRELVLTGIEIASYGSDLPGRPDLAAAVEAIADAAPQLRLRLGSLEPTAVTEEFCARLARTGRVCDHFHLSLQSGCDSTLGRMRRKYTTEEFFAVAERLRRHFPHCALTGDLIAGFPGETEREHEQTLRFIERCDFAALHVFPYSRRPGTPADKLPGQLTAAEKARRAHEAHAVAGRSRAAYLRSCVGMELSVLFETEENGVSTGHASNYMEVSVPGTNLRGLVKKAQITGVSGEMLVGVAV